MKKIILYLLFFSLYSTNTLPINHYCTSIRSIIHAVSKTTAVGLATTCMYHQWYYLHYAYLIQTFKNRYGDITGEQKIPKSLLAHDGMGITEEDAYKKLLCPTDLTVLKALGHNESIFYHQYLTPQEEHHETEAVFYAYITFLCTLLTLATR